LCPIENIILAFACKDRGEPKLPVLILSQTALTNGKQ